MKPMLSSQFLAWRLGLPLKELRVIAKEANKHYREISLNDHEKGKVRLLKVPDEELKKVQRRILRRVLSEASLPDGLHGGIPGRSPKTNAERHLGKDLVVNLDVRNFFPSVSHRQVAEMFRRGFGCGREARWLLTRLTTIDGQLPQGAPTSTMIANLLLAIPVDVPIERRADQLRVEYTRFVDDVTFSGESADKLISETAKAVSSVGLRTWRKRKLKITPRSRRQEVTGLTVNSSSGPSVSRTKRDKIRAAIHEIKTTQGEKELEKKTRSVRGRLNHLRQFNPGSARRLQRQLESVLRAR